MAVKIHSAKASMKSLELCKQGDSAIVVQAYNDEKKLGTLLVGQGGITWKPRDGRKGRRYSWTKVAETL